MSLLKIEEFFRGSRIIYQETNQLKHKDYLKYFETEVWGTTDNEGTDVLEIGKNGCLGYIELNCVIGIDITEDILLEYGFVLIKNFDNCSTYYRDDFGYVKLDVYGVEHVYMKGKAIKYLHNFQRIFFDYTGRRLVPKPSDVPKVEPKFSYQLIKPKGADEMLKEIDIMKKRSFIDTKDLSFEL